VQTANALSQSREAQAMARATAKEQEEERRSEVTIRTLENERQKIEAQTNVRIAQEKQRGAVGVQEATRNAESEVAGVIAQIEAEKQRIEMIKAQLQANTIVPAQAAKQKRIEEARGEAATIRGQAQAEVQQLAHTIAILQAGGSQGLTAYTIEKFGGLVEAFAQTMTLFPVQHISVIAGRREPEGPISAIHPNAIDATLNERIATVLGGVAQTVPA
jgi:hypothetical protein